MANILVIDDEALLRELIVTALQLDGHAVTTLDDLSRFDPAQAIFHSIDLLLTDVNMKPINGFEIVNRLRASGFNGPVLFMSGYSKLSGEPTGASANCAILDKPFTAGELRSAVRGVLGGENSASRTDRAPAGNY